MEVWQPHKRWVERSRENAGYGRTGKPDPRALASSDSESGGQFPGSLLSQHWAGASDLCAAGDNGASDRSSAPSSSGKRAQGQYLLAHCRFGRSSAVRAQYQGPPASAPQSPSSPNTRRAGYALAFRHSFLDARGRPTRAPSPPWRGAARLSARRDLAQKACRTWSREDANDPHRSGPMTS